jgi:hypothetical protein
MIYIIGEMKKFGTTKSHLKNQDKLERSTISLEMPVPSQGHYGFHSFPVVD